VTILTSDRLLSNFFTAETTRAVLITSSTVKVRAMRLVVRE
jgi:hypothetical protein